LRRGWLLLAGAWILLLAAEPMLAAAPPPEVASEIQNSIFRLRSNKTGTAFVVMKQGQRLFLVTALHVLRGDDGTGAAAVGTQMPCVIDRGSTDSAVACEVRYTYPDIDVAVLTADVPGYTGHPLALGASNNIEPDTKLLTCGFPQASTHVVWDSGQYRDRTPPYAFRVTVSASEGQSGSPLIDNATHQVVGIVLTRGAQGADQIAQMIETVEIALRGELMFRGVIHLNQPPALAPGPLTTADYGASLLNAFEVEEAAAVGSWYKRAHVYQRTDTESPWLGDEDGWMGLQRVYVSSRKEDTGLGRGWIHGFQYRIELGPTSKSDLCTIYVTNSEGVHEKFTSLQECKTIKSALAARVDDKSKLDQNLGDILADDQLALVLPNDGPSYVGADLEVARARFVAHGIEISTSTMTYTFDAKGLLRNVKKRKLDVALTYDAQDRLVLAKDPLRTMRFEYDGAHLSAVSFSDGSKYFYNYSGAGDLSTVTFNGDVVQSYEYDANHRLVHVVQPAKKAHERNIVYSDGNAISEVRTPETIYHWTFDEDGDDSVVHQTLSDPKSKEKISDRTFTFSLQDRSIKKVEDGDETVYKLTVCLCLPLTVINNGRSTTYRYDVFGRIIHKETPLETTDVEYDDKWSKVSKVSRKLRSGTVLSNQYVYNQDGNLIEASEDYRDGSDGDAKQPLRLTYVGSLIHTMTRGDQTLTFTYNSHDKPVTITSGSGTVKFTYKAENPDEVDKIETVAGKNGAADASLATETMHMLQMLIDMTAPARVTVDDTGYTKVTHIPGDGNRLCNSCEAKEEGSSN
jgi:YD repeat-containing protein